jgi:hypothetical protein
MASVAAGASVAAAGAQAERIVATTTSPPKHLNNHLFFDIVFLLKVMVSKTVKGIFFAGFLPIWFLLSISPGWIS